MPVLEYTLIRSRRKTISIQVTREAEVVVRAPLRAPIRAVEGFLAQKRGWIEKKQQQVLSRPAAFGRMAWKNGDEIPYLGARLMLVFRPGVKSAQISGGSLLLPERYEGNAQEILRKWYRARLLSLLDERVRYWAARTGLEPGSVRITGARGRWGSCSTSGNLNFTWRLVLAGPDAIDYVVLHEIAHIRHHNHSKAFWACVEAYMPDWRMRREWLRANANLLLFL